MFLKKQTYQNTISGVRFINGIVYFRNFKLNVHCFETDGVLIDTGARSLLKEFKPFFHQMDVDKVLITHAHEDHTGGARYLRSSFGLPIYHNEISIKESAKRADYPLYRKLFWGSRHKFRAHPIGDTFHSRNAEWDVIPTPGHKEDHLAFLNKETGQLFSGDLYVQRRTKLVLRSESIPEIMRSIERVLTYGFDEMFCCHAGYVQDGRKAMAEKLEYLSELEHRTFHLHHQGLSIEEIDKELFPKTYPIRYLSSGEWDSIHVIRSILYDN